jgi:putative GTP pyrophosphokinase
MLWSARQAEARRRGRVVTAPLRLGADRAYIARKMTHWLDVASSSGATEAVISAMAKKHHVRERQWISKGAVNRAGAALRAEALTDGHAVVLESWRISHRQVIHTFEALLRARVKNQDIEVAQRLKRRHTIIDKLERYPGMQLARMDDVAGCRLIFPDIESLRMFRDGVHRARFNHILKNAKDKYDYIERPTDRGYRGIHDVYEYRARKGRSTACNGLLVEIQYRTQIQHAWATAVEVVTQITEHEPKFNRGDPRYIRLFCLASEMLARVNEGKKSCMPDLSDRVLVEEFDKLDGEIDVIRTLLNLSTMKWIGDRAKAEHIILQITKAGELKLHQFDLELEASKNLLELEKEFPEDNIVLVGAKTVSEVVSAFRNYFNDVSNFLALYVAARKELSKDGQ